MSRRPSTEQTPLKTAHGLMVERSAWSRYLVDEFVSEVVEGRHTAPGDAVIEDALSHLHEDALDTVPLDLADQAGRTRQTTVSKGIRSTTTRHVC